MWDEEAFGKVCARIDSYRDEAVRLQKELTKRVAISPASGGKGELQKVRFLWEYLQGAGLGELEMVEAPDERAEGGVRPSLILRRKGETDTPTVWIMTHTDVVPAGTSELWENEPFEATVKDDRVYGRGTEDNQQSLIASILALKAVVEEGVVLSRSVGLLFVADEETGSEYGIEYVLKHGNPFKKTDWIIVPDGGMPEGDMVEVAEKSILWLKLQCVGKQGHGARPSVAVNAHRAGANLLLRLDEELHRRFVQKNALFQPPESTFEPTKKEANVDNVNTIPGEDIFYFDCRILPEVAVDDVLSVVREVAADIEEDFGVSVDVGWVQRQDAAPVTPVDAPVVGALKAALRKVCGVEGKPMGVGGGTVAAFLRKAGYHTAVWGKIDGKAHQPNEYCLLDNLLTEAKVFAHMFGKE